MRKASVKALFEQAIRFLAVSGSGWLLDFGVFWLLTRYAGLPVVYANMLSSIPAVTFVFTVSTRKIFSNRKEGLPLWGKYAVYFLYQMVLVACVSWIGEGLYRVISDTALMELVWVAGHLKLLCKVLITPLTMTANFFVMKFLCEKL